MFDINNPAIKFAILAVRKASSLVHQVQSEIETTGLMKGDLSPVTVADYASQAVVGFLLSETFPQDHLVAEEDSAALQDPANGETLKEVTRFVSRLVPSATDKRVCAWIDRGGATPGDRFWTLDPIDGTKGFLRGDQYAVALALVEGSRVQIGVLGCPNLSHGFLPDLNGYGSLVVGVRGQGSWAKPLRMESSFKRLSISPQQDPTQARLVRSHVRAHTNTEQIDQLIQGLGIQTEPVRLDSQAKYAVLAAGQGEIYLRLLSPSKPNYREKIWDQAAGSIIVEEAGGRVTDLYGKTLDFRTGRSLKDNRGILATNGHLHETTLGALQVILA